MQEFTPGVFLPVVEEDRKQKLAMMERGRPTLASQ